MLQEEFVISAKCFKNFKLINYYILNDPLMHTLSTSTDSQYVNWLNTGDSIETGNYKNNNN